MEINLSPLESGHFLIRYGDDQYVFTDPEQGWDMAKRVMNKLTGKDSEPLLIWTADDGSHHVLSITPGVKISLHIPAGSDPSAD